MIAINVVGQPCPIPVVKAKKAIASLPGEGGVIEVMVDNQIACENLAKMTDGLGHAHETRQLDDGNFVVTIRVGAAVNAQSQATMPHLPQSGVGLVVAVGSDCMGRGDDNLGKILIKSFLYSLTQLDTPLQAVVFFNSGVRLVLQGANTVDDVRALVDNGCNVLVCGTCLDFYQCKEQVAVGEVGNMYSIVEAMSAGRSVISI